LLEYIPLQLRCHCFALHFGLGGVHVKQGMRCRIGNVALILAGR